MFIRCSLDAPFAAGTPRGLMGKETSILAMLMVHARASQPPACTRGNSATFNIRRTTGREDSRRERRAYERKIAARDYEPPIVVNARRACRRRRKRAIRAGIMHGCRGSSFRRAFKRARVPLHVAGSAIALHKLRLACTRDLRGINIIFYAQSRDSVPRWRFACPLVSRIKRAFVRRTGN